MSKIPIPMSAKNTTATPRHSTYSKNKEKSFIKYPKLDLTKIGKCSDCKNYVDLTCEGWDQDRLADYGKLNGKDASSIYYTCNHCTFIRKALLEWKARLEANEDEIDRAKAEVVRAKAEMDKITQLEKESTLKTEFVSKFQVKIESLSKELSNMQNVLVKREEVDQQILGIKEKLHNFVKRVSSANSFLTHPKPNEREYHNQYIRRNRVVCIGVPKGASDMEFVMELAKELNLDLDKSNIVKMFRINAKNIPSHKTLPLNIEFRNFSDKVKILSQITKEKVYSLPNNSKFKNVKIFPDRTFKQREQFKALKHEMSEKNQELETQNILSKKFIIKNMVLTKINVPGEEGKMD